MSKAVATALAALGTVALAAGCIFDGCGPTYHQLTWTEPGFYASLRGSEPAWMEWDPGAGALPWNNSAWHGLEPWPGVRLVDVGLAVPQPPGERRGIYGDVQPALVEGIGIGRDGIVTAYVAGDAPEADLRAAFERILTEATTGLDPHALWPGFRDSRTPTGMLYGVPIDPEATEFEERPQYAHHLDVRGHLRLDELAERIALPPPTQVGHGATTTTAGDWTFSFSLPVWTIRGEDGDLHVDSADNVLFDDVGFPTEEKLREAARSTALLVGRDPDLSAAESSASIC